MTEYDVTNITGTQPRENMITMGKVDTSDLMMIIIWAIDISFQLPKLKWARWTHTSPFIVMASNVLGTPPQGKFHRHLHVLNACEQSSIMMIMRDSKMPITESDLRAIMYPAYDTPHRLCNCFFLRRLGPCMNHLAPLWWSPFSSKGDHQKK